MSGYELKTCVLLKLYDIDICTHPVSQICDRNLLQQYYFHVPFCVFCGMAGGGSAIVVILGIPDRPLHIVISQGACRL